MRKLLILVALACAGCCGPKLETEAIEPVLLKVCERHDKYVAADAEKDEATKKRELRSTALIRAALEESKKGD